MNHPDEVEHRAALGPVLISHPNQRAGVIMARELKNAGWLASVVAESPGVKKPAVLIVDAGDAERAVADVARTRRSDPHTPVLFLATTESFEDLLRIGTRPGDDYLTAPFTAADVASRLRWLTRTAVSASDPELTVGDLKLRPRCLLARRGDHEIPLTKTQCSLLGLLMQNPGRVISKGELANRIWPDNNVRGANNVELHISYLRQRINAAGPPMIHTRRGAGYLIRPAQVS
ncbi:response regulator transcription factor [Arthrobacter sp. NPDC057259]|uniref:response regulator transcription factor n=1 Tax=Arthrobacter sp. NPDC057259 TaxID=3346073 RepID=UPI0036442863